MSELPRKFTNRTLVDLRAIDFSMLLDIYYFIKNEMILGNIGLDKQSEAVCYQKLSEIRRIIESSVFGDALPVNTKSIKGDKPEDIDLSKFEEMEQE